MTASRNKATLAVAVEMWREFTPEGRQALIDALEAGLPSEAVACSVADAAARILRAAAEPEAKAPVCDHGQPPTSMVPCLRIKGSWECKGCGAWKSDPQNPSGGAP